MSQYPTFPPPDSNPYETAQPLSTPSTAPLGSSSAGRPSGPPSGPPVSPPSGPPVRRGRAGFAAAVVGASLLVGGAAGVGGAAAWNAIDDQPASSSASEPAAARTTSQVSSTPDTDAPEGSVQQVAASILPSVVKLNVSGTDGAGSGSGIILSSDGQILTNDHVASLAGDSGTITVSFNDGTKTSATVLGTDPLTDTAVIQATDVSGLTPAPIGQSSNLDVGEQVVAIGSPFGLESTVTSGIVSALDRPVDVGSDGQGNNTTYPAIQTDAAINPGNSGGPLLDMAGDVIGINSSIRTASSSMSEESGSIGLGFAIPIDSVLPIVEQMANGETPTHARLGISVGDVANSTGAEVTEGALIREITNGSAAGSAGLKDGDVITQIDDKLISGADSLVATIRTYRPGDEVTVTYERNGESATTMLTLDSDADSSAS